MSLGLHVIKYPTGRFGFVGSVPACLAFEGSAEDLETARICGPGLARRIAERNGRSFVTLTWASEADAVSFAAARGFVVAGSLRLVGGAV